MLVELIEGPPREIHTPGGYIGAAVGVPVEVPDEVGESLVEQGTFKVTKNEEKV